MRNIHTAYVCDGNENARTHKLKYNENKLRCLQEMRFLVRNRLEYAGIFRCNGR